MAPIAAPKWLAIAFADLAALPHASRLRVAHRLRLRARCIDQRTRLLLSSLHAHHGGPTRASRTLHVCALTVQNEGTLRRVQDCGLTLALQSRSPVRPLADTAGR